MGQSYQRHNVGILKMNRLKLILSIVRFFCALFRAALSKSAYALCKSSGGLIAHCGQSTPEVFPTRSCAKANYGHLGQRRFDMLMWYQAYWLRHRNGNEVSRSRFDSCDSCSTAVIGSRTCQEVATLLFRNFPWEGIDLSLHYSIVFNLCSLNTLEF